MGKGDRDQVLPAGRNDGTRADKDQRERADKFDDTVLQPILFHESLLCSVDGVHVGGAERMDAQK